MDPYTGPPRRACTTTAGCTATEWAQAVCTRARPHTPSSQTVRERTKDTKERMVETLQLGGGAWCSHAWTRQPLAFEGTDRWTARAPVW